ncbi:MAG: hypothetical protein V2J02_15190 [Pseudomonadales bacterium]|jgi:hypothetical protein|nr:hypothetical protein [Pseudomonadales bacterium]
MRIGWIPAVVVLGALQVPASHAAQEAGDRVFTLSGSGSSDNDFDSTSAGVNAQLGWMRTDHLELGLRQNVAGNAIREGQEAWSGSTFGYGAWNFGDGDVVPYLGANLGFLYGENVKDTSAAGLEAGVRFYVKEKTFIAAQLQYEFLFDDADDIDSRFNNGAFFYGLGIGFNF